MPEDMLTDKAASQLRTFLKDCRITEPKDKKILEVGFKNGLFLRQCQLAGINPTGLEVNRLFYEKVKSKSPHLDLICYEGLEIPLPDESFDYVVSFQVLEHVQDLQTTLAECARVLRPGGLMYHICPNYFSFYEGHYKIIWLPFLTKSAGRLYLKLLRRYSPYYEHLNLITPRKIKKILRPLPLETISLGKPEFIKRFDSPQASKINHAFLRKIVGSLGRREKLGRAFAKIIAAANLYYPVTLIAKKTKNVPA